MSHVAKQVDTVHFDDSTYYLPYVPDTSADPSIKNQVIISSHRAIRNGTGSWMSKVTLLDNLFNIPIILQKSRNALYSFRANRFA